MYVYIVTPDDSPEDTKVYRKLCRAYEYASARIRRDLGVVRNGTHASNVNFDMWIGDVEIELEEPEHSVDVYGYNSSGEQGKCNIRKLPICD